MGRWLFGGGGGVLLGCCFWTVMYRLAAHKYVLLAHGHKLLPNERSFGENRYTIVV